MKFALIKADFVNDDLIAEHGDLPDMFGRLFGGVELDVYEARQHRLPDPAGYDACVVTGSRYSVNDDRSWVHELLAFLRDTVAACALPPIIGFCFGHQALAKALGGSVATGPCAWNLGVWPVGQPHRPATGPGALHALFNHREQVVVVPRGAEVLASTDRCPVQMMAIGDRALGMQFHPEYTLAYQEALMGVARGLPGDVRQDALLRNRTSQRNDAIARDWVLELATRHRRGQLSCAGA